MPTKKRETRQRTTDELTDAQIKYLACGISRKPPGESVGFRDSISGRWVPFVDMGAEWGPRFSIEPCMIQCEHEAWKEMAPAEIVKLYRKLRAGGHWSIVRSAIHYAKHTDVPYLPATLRGRE